MTQLILVESPIKVPTIQSFFDKDDFAVLATCGHFLKAKSIREGLNFKEGKIIEERVLNLDKEPYTNSIIDCVRKNSIKSVYLAMDNDDEGDAIAHDIARYITDKVKPLNIFFKRVSFSSLSKNVICDAISHADSISINDLEKYCDSARSRRVMDKLISKYYINNGAYGMGRISGGILSIVGAGEQVLGVLPLSIKTTIGVFEAKVSFNSNDRDLWMQRKKDLEFFFSEAPLVLSHDFNVDELIDFEKPIGFDDIMSFLLKNNV